jgi:hypothetical protein
MLQWLGVLVPTAFRDEVRAAAAQQGKSVYQRTPRVDLHAKDLTCPSCKGPASKAELDDPHGCCADCYWKLPDGSVGDRQDRPEVYAGLDPIEAELWRGALETGVAIIGIDR